MFCLSSIEVLVCHVVFSINYFLLKIAILYILRVDFFFRIDYI